MKDIIENVVAHQIVVYSEYLKYQPKIKNELRKYVNFWEHYDDSGSTWGNRPSFLITNPFDRIVGEIMSLDRFVEPLLWYW